MSAASSSKIAGDGGFEITCTDAGLPATRGKLRAQVALDENAGLDALHRTRIARQRADDEGGAVDDQAEQHGIDQRIGVRPGKHLGARKQEVEDGGGQRRIVRSAKARHEQQVGPGKEAQAHASDGAAGIGTPPEQAGQQCGRYLRDRSKGQETDRGKAGCAIGGTVIGIAQHQHDENRRAADAQERLCKVIALPAGGHQLAAQKDRHDDVVGHHDG
jgi:hypothetical protein